VTTNLALETRGLVAGYEPGLPIVRGASIRVARGEIVLLLGPNGAGKSTLAKAIAGLVPVSAGDILADGASIAGVPTHRLIRRGLAFVPQTENVFTALSVRENLVLAAGLLPRGGARGCRTCWRSSPISRASPVRQPDACRAGSGRCWRSPGRSSSGHNS
jgi:ABC-type branched-subunit amino acid transport system ATPase component